jgi:hypothetical protein
VVAAACSRDPAKARTKVLDEAVGMRHGLQFAHAHDRGPTKRPDHIHDLEDHALVLRRGTQQSGVRLLARAADAIPSALRRMGRA